MLWPIDAHRQIEGGCVEARLAQGGRILAGGDGVQIDDAIEAVEVILHADPLTQGPHVVADGQLARGLGTAQNDWFSHQSSNPCYPPARSGSDQQGVEFGKLLANPVGARVCDRAAMVVAIGEPHHLHAGGLGGQHVIFGIPTIRVRDGLTPSSWQACNSGRARFLDGYAVAPEPECETVADAEGLQNGRTK